MVLIDGMNKIERWASIADCEIGSFPLNYLGRHLGNNPIVLLKFNGSKGPEGLSL